MKNWTIKKRIIAGFAIILMLVTILAIASFTLLRQIKTEANFMKTDALPGLEAMAKIRGSVSEIQIKVLRTLLATTPEDRKKFEDEVAAMRTDILKVMDDYDKSIHLPEDRDMFKQMETDRDAYVADRNHLFGLLHDGKVDEAKSYAVSNVRPDYEAYQTIVNKMLDWNIANGEKSGANSEKAANRANLAVDSLSIVVIVLGVVFASIIVTGLNRALRQVANALSEGSAQVASASGQVSASSQSLAEGASEQAASLEETSSSLEEMASMTKRNSENAEKANDLAKQARSAADRGTTDMQTMSSAMEAIKISSDDIAKIIKTIDEIAFQTNILALNAAVEAARAGEAGMGFAVVADEVRNLAQRSAQAAKETAAKIEGAIAKTAQGVDISSKVALTLNEIVTKIRRVDELVAEVTGASREQTQGITQINTAVSQMDKITQSNAANAEESAAAAEELNAQAASMKESVTELLQLVGGHNQPVVTRPASTPPRTNKSHFSALTKKRPAQIQENGHSHAETAMAGMENGRSEIPMDGGFRDF